MKEEPTTKAKAPKVAETKVGLPMAEVWLADTVKKTPDLVIGDVATFNLNPSGVYTIVTRMGDNIVRQYFAASCRVRYTTT